MKFLVLLLSLFPSLIFAAVNVELDQKKVSLGEPFDVHFVATDGGVGALMLNPDFSALDVLFQQVGTSKHQSFNFFKGKSEQQTAWVVSLIAKQVGKLTIPSIDFGRYGLSSPVVVEIVAGDVNNQNIVDEEDVLIEVVVNPETAFENEQVLVSVRVYYAVNLYRGNLTPLTIDGDAFLEPLGEEDSGRVRKNNRSYQYTERRYAITPQSGSVIKLNPVVLTAQIRRSMRAAVAITLKSKPLEINIKPLPEREKYPNGIVSEEVMLEEEWRLDGERVVVDSPNFFVPRDKKLERIVKLTAKGVEGEQLPELQTRFDSQLGAYPEKPQFNTVKNYMGATGYKEERVLFVAQQDVLASFEPIAVDYFDKSTVSWKQKTLPDRKIVFGQGTVSPRISLIPPPQSTEITKPMDEMPVKLKEKQENWYVWLIMLMLLSVIVGGHWGYKQKCPKFRDNQRLKREKELLEEVAEAASLEYIGLVKLKLLAWGGLRFTQDIKNLQTLKELLDNPSWNEEIMKLEQALYRGESAIWYGNRLSQLAKKEQANLRIKKGVKEAEILPSLYG